jgi:hypothetical protein
MRTSIRRGHRIFDRNPKSPRPLLRLVTFTVATLPIPMLMAAGPAQGASAAARPLILGVGVFSNGSLLVAAPSPPPIIPGNPVILYVPGQGSVPSPPPVVPITLSCTDTTPGNSDRGPSFYASGMGSDHQHYFIAMTGAYPTPPPVIPVDPIIPSPPQIFPSLGLALATSAGISTSSVSDGHCGAAGLATQSVTGALLFRPSPPQI